MNAARLIRVALAALFAVVFVRATCGRTKPVEEAPAWITAVEKMSISDFVPYHNMGIAWDGEYYYTVNGGNAEYSTLHRYDKDGEHDAQYDIEADGRSLMYHPGEELLYLKPYGLSLDEVDLDIEYAMPLHDDIFSLDQSSVTMSPDGMWLYELADGEVVVYDFEDGAEERRFDLPLYSAEDDGGYCYAIAASDEHLFVWAPDSDREVLAYDLEGNLVARIRLPRESFGFSLAWANGLLWASEDADGSTEGAYGTWYGYKLKGLK